MGMDDEFYYQPKNIHLRRKYVGNHEKAVDILSQYSGKSNKEAVNELTNSKFSAKGNDSDAGSYRGSVKNSSSQQNNSRFVRAGQNVLSNMSVSNASGRSSASSRKETHKENYSGVGRYCACATKNRTEEHKDLYCMGRKKTAKI